jgi:hypothetical protein
MGFRPLGYQEGGDVRNLGRIQGVRLSNQDLMETSPRVGEALGLYGTAGPAEAGPVGGVMTGLVGLPEAGENLGRIQGSGAAGAGVASDVMAIFQGLVDVARSGSVQDVAAYIEANRQDLNDMVSMMMLPQGQADFVRNTLSSFPSPQGMSRPSDRDIEQLLQIEQPLRGMSRPSDRDIERLSQIEQPPQSGFPEFRKALRDQEMLGEQDVVGSPNLPVIDTYQHDLEGYAPRVPSGAVPGPFGGIMSIGRR